MALHKEGGKKIWFSQVKETKGRLLLQRRAPKQILIYLEFSDKM